MQRTFLKLTLCLMAFAFIIPACAADVQVEKLGTIPIFVLTTPDAYKGWLRQDMQELVEHDISTDFALCTRSPYDRHVGTVAFKMDGKCCVWLDGKEGPEYDQVRGIVKGAFRSQDFEFSPDGSRLAYAARKGNKWVMVVDGKESAAFDGVREPYFSADSKHTCYVGFRGKNCIPVLDGKELGNYPPIKLTNPYFTARTPVREIDTMYCPGIFGTSGRFAFVVVKGCNLEVAVIDGKETAEYEKIAGVEFSPDGKHTALAVQKGGKMFVLLDGKPGPKYDEVDGIFTFSPDSKRLAYVATNYDANSDPITFVVIDGKPGPKFKDLFSLSIAFSPDCKHFSYIAECGEEKYCLVEDGKPGKAYDEIGGNTATAFQIYGPDGKLYYCTRNDDKYRMVVDGVPSRAYDYIANPIPVLSRDGKHYAFAAQEGDNWLVVKDGVEGPIYSGIDHETIAITGSNKLSYTAQKPGSSYRVAVVDSRELPGTSHVTFSADGTQMACIKDVDDWKNPVLAVVNGQEIGRFMAVLNMSFDENNTLTFLAVRDNSQEDKLPKDLYRVRVTP
ncbi:MAG: hypothetical protein ABFD64_13200 [Armatimonadota bacterium]